MKENKKENFDKKLLSKKKKIILIVAIIGILAVGITVFLLLRNNDDKKVINTEPTISMLTDGTYYIFGAKENQSFELDVENNFSYKIVDDENNEIKTTITEKNNRVIINAPENLYEKGKNYTLTIENGTFVNEELKNAKSVLFNIRRDSKQVSTFKSDVAIVPDSSHKVIENGGKITLTTDRKYEKGQVIIIEGNNGQNAYKIANENDEGYVLSKPELNEVYEELDYYGTEVLDLSNFIVEEEIQDFLAMETEKNILESLIPTVQAANKAVVKTEWDKKKEELVVKVDVETASGEKLFKKSFLDHHAMIFKFEMRYKVIFNGNVDLLDGKYDVNISLKITEKPSVTFEYNNGKIKEIQKSLNKYASTENTFKTLKIDYDKLKKDKKEVKQKLGTVLVPTPISGLNFEIGVALIMDLSLKADIFAKATITKNIVIGVSNENGIYGNYKKKTDINAGALGEAKMRLGAEGLLGFNFVGAVKLNATVEGGVYGKASVEISSSMGSSGLDANFEVKGEAGLFSELKANAEVFGNKMEHTIVDEEYKLFDINDLFTGKNNEKEETVSKEENDDEVEEELQIPENKNDEEDTNKDENTEQNESDSNREEEKPVLTQSNGAYNKFVAAMKVYAKQNGMYMYGETKQKTCQYNKDACFYDLNNYVDGSYESVPFEKNISYYIVRESNSDVHRFEISASIGNGAYSGSYNITTGEVTTGYYNSTKSRIESSCQLFAERGLYDITSYEQCVDDAWEDGKYGQKSYIEGVFNSILKIAGITKEEYIADIPFN